MNGDLNEAIDQVANHLGVTVNQLLPYFDSYAQMQSFTSWYYMLVVIGIALVLLCLIIGAIVAHFKNGEIGDLEKAIFLFGGPTFIVVCFLVASCAIQWQQWTLYPDGKLVEMVLGALK